MKICVTGGAGFLGSHLVETLLVQGYEVTVIDDFSTGNEENLAAAKSIFGSRLRVRCRDVLRICDDRSWKHDRFDVYFNLACPASPKAYQANPVRTTMICTLGTKNVLDLATDDDAIVIHASTSEIYGDPEVHPQHESYKGRVNTMGPRACYDEGKRLAETLCYDYILKGTKAKVMRIFNTYGPRMAADDGRVVSNFVVQALQQKPLTVYGDGSQTRSFCYVDDLIQGFVALMNSPASFNGPVNLGNPSEFSMLELATLVRQKVESVTMIRSGDLLFQALPQDDPRQRCPDITLAREVLGWEPRVSLSAGVERTIGFFRHILG